MDRRYYVVLAAGIMAFGTMGCSAKMKCDDAKIAEVARPALEGMPAGKRADFAVKLLTETCAEPEGLRTALGDWDITPPDQRGQVLARAIEANSGLWKKGCSGGTDVFEGLANASMEQRGELLFSGCNLGRFEGVTAATLNPDTAMIGVLYAPVLDASSAPAADKRAIMNALLVR